MIAEAKERGGGGSDRASFRHMLPAYGRAPDDETGSESDRSTG